MFWNDIKEWMGSVCYRLTDLQITQVDEECIRCLIKDELSNLNRKLDMIFEIVNESQDFHIANHTMDTFEDYMKNVDKLNTMINEFKGCVAMARGSLEEKKRVIKTNSEKDKL